MAQFIKNNPERFIEKYDAIFTHDQELIDIDPNTFKFAYGQGSIVEETGIFPKTKLVSAVLSDKAMSDGHKLRIEIGKQLVGTEVDVYGKLYDKFIKRKIDGIKDYMFNFAIENHFYPHYFTEKLHDCFTTGTIPIYLGDPKIAEYYNTDGIIQVKYEDGQVEFDSSLLTEDFYYDRMDAIEDNYNRIIDQQTVEDYIYLNYFND